DCDSGSPERLAVRLSQVRIDGETKGAPQVRGHLLARLPLRLVDRFAPSMRGTGWVGFSGDIAITGDCKLREVSGQVTGASMSLDADVIAEELSAEVLISADVIQAPTLDARWGNGSAHLEGFKMEPFKEKMPVSIERLVTKDVDFPGVMRDVDVTPHSWVEWN